MLHVTWLHDVALVTLAEKESHFRERVIEFSLKLQCNRSSDRSFSAFWRKF